MSHEPLPPLPDLPLGTYRHFKGGRYQVHGLAYMHDSLDPFVMYASLYEKPGCPLGTYFVRPYSNFIAAVVNAAGENVPRFSREDTV